jgi:hypothetical protein
MQEDQGLSGVQLVGVMRFDHCDIFADLERDIFKELGLKSGRIEWEEARIYVDFSSRFI